MTNPLQRDFGDDCTSALAGWYRLILADGPITRDQAAAYNALVGNSFNAGYAMAAYSVMTFVAEALQAQKHPREIAQALLKQLEPLATKARGETPQIH